MTPTILQQYVIDLIKNHNYTLADACDSAEVPIRLGRRWAADSEFVELCGGKVPDSRNEQVLSIAMVCGICKGDFTAPRIPEFIFMEWVRKHEHRDLLPESAS